MIQFPSRAGCTKGKQIHVRKGLNIALVRPACYLNRALGKLEGGMASFFQPGNVAVGYIALLETGVKRLIVMASSIWITFGRSALLTLIPAPNRRPLSIYHLFFGNFILPMR